MKTREALILILLFLSLILFIPSKPVQAFPDSVPYSYTAIDTIPLTPAAYGSWQIYNVSTALGVDVSGQVIEILLRNSRANAAVYSGVRTRGSTLDRFIDIGSSQKVSGANHIHTFVRAGVGSYAGLIEIFSGNSDGIPLAAGYFENVTYTESFRNVSVDTYGSWTSYNLYQNDYVPYQYVADIALVHDDNSDAKYIGVRTSGSSINRRVEIASTIDGTGYDGFNGYGQLVKSGLTGLIEYYVEDSDCYLMLMGFFSTNLDFIEKYEVIAPPGAGWQTIDMTGYDVTLNATIYMVGQYGDTTDDEYMGYRPTGSGLGKDVTMSRPNVGGGYNTMGMLSEVDGSNNTDAISEDNFNQRHLYMGYMEWREAVNPTPLSVYILNWIEPNYLVSRTIYYQFQATYQDPGIWSNLTDCMIAWTDEVTWINATYNLSTEGFNLDSGDNVSSLHGGTVTNTSNTDLQIIFEFYLDETIFDAHDCDIYLRVIDNEDVDSGWVQMQLDYFNIYNLGGYSELLGSGSATRSPGGDVFEVYCDNDSWVAVNQTWYHLQHYHTQFAIRLMRNDTNVFRGEDELWQDSGHREGLDVYAADKGDWALNISIWYYDAANDDYVKGWTVQLKMEEGDKGPNDFWTMIESSWFIKDTLMKTDTWYAWIEEEPQARIRIWVDLWFSLDHESTRCSGRVNAMYHGMENTGWLMWANWAPMMGNVSQSMFSDTLLDVHNTGISAQALDFMKIGFNLSRPTTGGNANDFRIELREFDIQDRVIKRTGEMWGIDGTPIFVDTKVPDMPQTGFLAALGAVLQHFGDGILEGLGFATTYFWPNFVAFLDSVAASFGYPYAFSRFTIWIQSFWDWMFSGITYSAILFTSMFSFFNSTLTPIITNIGRLITQFISFWNIFWQFMFGAYTSGFDFYNDFNIPQWITLAAILYPVYLLYLLTAKGSDALINHLTFFMNIVSFIVSIFLSIANFVVSLIQSLVGAIRG